MPHGRPDGFADEVVPVEIKGRKGVQRVDRDDHMRPETTIEILAKLPPAFKKDGTVTAGNASGIVDGGAALILASREAADRHRLKPLGRLIGWASVGVEPSLMGMGPAPATRKVLAQAGLTLADIDLIEINEAFAGQYLAVEKELGLDRDKVNVNGGAIALGHPLGHDRHAPAADAAARAAAPRKETRPCDRLHRRRPGDRRDRRGDVAPRATRTAWLSKRSACWAAG